MTRLLLVAGSPRRASLNAGLLAELALRLQGRCEIDVLQPAEVRLPVFNQDLEQDAATMAEVVTLHRRFAACDGLVIASPEYNGQLPPYLKNLIDWVSRLPHVDPRADNPFLQCPVLLCSASTGWSGGALAIPHARALFGYLGADVLGEPLCVPHADQAWDGQAFVFDPFFEDRIDGAAERILHAAKQRRAALTTPREAACPTY